MFHTLEKENVQLRNEDEKVKIHITIEIESIKKGE